MKDPGRPLNVHTDHCPCGSGRLMINCCLFVRRETRPPEPATGYAHQKCFARDLADCSETISREHFISRSILELFGKNGITVSGMPWIPDGEQRRVSPASLTGKMLCERHNHVLSPLDSVAAEFFRFFTDEWSGDPVEVFLTRGYDLERWLLKMLCGLVASGNATLDGRRLPAWTPPQEWLDILFGEADVSTPAGLHSIVGHFRAADGSLHVVPVFNSATGYPTAIVFAVEGIGFLFTTEKLPGLRKPTTMGADTRYRPLALQIRRAGRIREAHFGWPDGELVSCNVGE
jgi:hypothetical protein